MYCWSGMGESSFYRLNRERAIAWLKKKVNALAERLEEERVYVGSGARSLALADSKQLEVTQGLVLLLLLLLLLLLFLCCCYYSMLFNVVGQHSVTINIVLIWKSCVLSHLSRIRKVCQDSPC